MGIDVGARPSKLKGYGLVRDRDGRPKLDKITDIPKPIWALLTQDERREIKDRGGYPSNQ